MSKEQRDKPRIAMSPIKSKALTDRFMSADDIHWTCPKCKVKRQGTMEHVMEGCDCG